MRKIIIFIFCISFLEINAKTSNRIIEPQKVGYVNPKLFKEGLAAVYVQNKWGYVDSTRTIVIPCNYDYALDFKDGNAAVKVNDSWGVINKKGKIVVPIKYNSVTQLDNGQVKVELLGEEKVINVKEKGLKKFFKRIFKF